MTGAFAFRIVVAVLALIPIVTGAAGVALGPRLVGGLALWPPDLDSHFRFLSAIFLAIGLGFYSTLWNFNSTFGRFRLLAILVIAGGFGRGLSLALEGAPSLPHIAGLGMELAVVPALLYWRGQLADRSRNSGAG